MMTGVIPRNRLPTTVLLVNDEEPEKVTSVSYKIKIKHLCPPCQVDTVSEFKEGRLKPLHHALQCSFCDYRAIDQPYAKICSLCSVLRNLCIRCMEPEETENPIDEILTDSLRKFLDLLPTQIHRDILHRVYKLLNHYDRGKMSIDEARVAASKDMLFWFYYYNPQYEQIVEKFGKKLE